MADAAWSMNNWKMPEWGLSGSESGIFVGADEDDYSSTPRCRSASMSAAPSLQKDGIPKATVVSKLDPNSKPFSPRSSPSSQEKCYTGLGSPEGYSEFKMPPSFSNDSGCHLFDDKPSPDSPKGYSASQREMDIQSLVERKMRSEVEKLEELGRRQKMAVGVPFRISSGSSSSGSSFSRRNQEARDDTVFAVNGSNDSMGSWAKACSGSGKGFSKSDSPLLPTPEDFPPFGPVNSNPEYVRPGGVDEDEADNFGLRSLARIIQQGAEPKQGGVSSVVSVEELGFDRHFVENCFPKYQYMGSPFDNRVLSLLSDYHGVPEEYLNGGMKLEKLPEADLQTAPSDLLFFLFYVAVEHVWQIHAAYELFKRGWKYHKRYQIWLAVLGNERAGERTSLYERGKYQYFNYRSWKREVAEFTILYEDMAGIDMPPPNPSLKRMKLGDTDFLAKAHQLAQNYQLQMARSKANPPGFENLCQAQMEMSCRRQRYPAWPNF